MSKSTAHAIDLVHPWPASMTLKRVVSNGNHAARFLRNVCWCVSLSRRKSNINFAATFLFSFPDSVYSGGIVMLIVV